MPDMVLLSGDVDAIKEFVFETSSLPQIRGGSQLLIECEEAIPTYVQEAGGEVIYCNGGSFLLKVPSDQAERIKQRIERLYLEKTLVATVTVVEEQGDSPPPSAAPVNGWAGRILQAAQQTVDLDGGFAQRVFSLGARLREAKAGKAQAPFFESLPFGKRCESCGKRMAQERREPRGQALVEKEPACPICSRRHSEGISSKEETRGTFNRKFQAYLERAYGECTARQAPDLDHMVESSRRSHLAFIYADGNDIGGLLNRAKDEQEYQALSEALYEGTKQALFDALGEVCQAALESEDHWPFEIINIGGDDVTLLIQAGYAWEVAVKFLDNFERQVRQRIEAKLGQWHTNWPANITASCGIAIADVKYPMRYLRLLADDLLKRAKKLAKAERGNLQSAIDFLWLPNPVASERVEPLMDYYEQDNQSLTARPYTLEQACKLLDLVKQASVWSYNQRYQWGEALERGMWVSFNAIYYNVARCSDEKERFDLSRFLNEVGATIATSGQPQPAPLWKSDDRGRYCTALLDVLELAELRAMRADVKEQEESL